MRRRIQGLHAADQSAVAEIPDGLFLVRSVTEFSITGTRRNRTTSCALPFSSPIPWPAMESQAVSTAAIEPCGNCPGSYAILATTPNCSGEMIEEKSLIGLRGVVKVSHTVVNGTSLLNFDGFAQESQWEELSPRCVVATVGGNVMTYSYTQSANT